MIRSIILVMAVIFSTLNLLAAPSLPAAPPGRENFSLMRGARLDKFGIAQEMIGVADFDDGQIGVLVVGGGKRGLYGLSTSQPLAQGAQYILSLVSGEPVAGGRIQIRLSSVQQLEGRTLVNGIGADLLGTPAFELQSTERPRPGPKKTPYEQCTEACVEYTRGLDYLLCLEGCWIIN